MAMQAKAKQLVMIYKLTQESATTSASILVHMAPPTQTDKGAPNQDQNNQHQLAPIQTQTSNRVVETLPVLEGVKVKIEVEEVPRDEITTITDLKIAIGEEAGVPLEAIITVNKGKETANMNLRIGRIGHEITQMDKEGDIIVEIMRTQGSTVGVGEAIIIIIIIGDSITITEPEAVVGIHNKAMTSKVNLINHTETIANIPNCHNIMTNNPDQPNPNKQLIYANCVITKDILIINANLQVILWKEPSKL